MLGGLKQNCVPTRTQEEESVTPQDTEPDFPVRVQESPVEAWINSGCHGVRGTEYNSPGISTFEGGRNYPVIRIIVWPQTNLQGGTQHHPSTENWIKDLLSMALPIRARPRFLHSQILPSGRFHKPFILSHQRADRMETTIT